MANLVFIVALYAPTAGCVQILESQDMEYKIQTFQAWRVTKLGLDPGKSSAAYMFSAFTYIIIVLCQTRFDLLFSIILSCRTTNFLITR